MKKIGGITDGKVRRKRKTPDVFSSSSERKKLESAVRRSPPVVVKITGGCKGAAHIKSHLEYISRNGKLELENEQGDKLEGREALNNLHKLWESNPGKSSEKTKHTLNMVFSMPEGTDSKAIQQAVRDLALKEFGDNYRYVMALHTAETDKKTKQPHVHLTVNTTGHDLTRFSLGRGDLQRLRDEFAVRLREQGIAADSTKREARGITVKAIKTPIQQMNQRGVMPKVEEGKYREVARELVGG
ncbi:relaxase/mobilization nuclease domain-containing protein [Iodobacter sp. BJB302]|uniref:relaxase/mobilization nuclease domain-containing protein n=1 Tax=Iodobacter sp. BJB302 TaxID=1506510 RepID=UPI000C0E9B70|nr:relaxase/mobilization nuclease domain-containing protein [Iodobacter sp. BJB302]PHU99797.1 hypothetical protein CSQ88_20555 [Iodobacter sp. BJB302]